MRNNIKILDCTLRDGGYVNNWEFGENTICSIINKLIDANIDIVECGFLSETKKSSCNSSIFNSLRPINKILESASKKNDFACMINYGEFPIEALPKYSGNGIDTIRIAFHKKDLKHALDFCQQVKEKGYSVFVQPMITASYNEKELKILIEAINSFIPTSIYIVDSFGTLRKNELLSLFQFFDKNIKQNIEIGFHSHNNLQLSFSNAQELIQNQTSRMLIIDSSVFGMGRGAGNLCTELLLLHLNENFNKDYCILPILEIIDEFLNPIFIKKPWGYSVPYYIASTNNCHPNYASYLTDKQTLSTKDVNLILSQIPQENKNQYCQNIIEELYVNHLSQRIDDSENINKLTSIIGQKPILIIAPGKTIKTHEKAIKEHIEKIHPLILAINFVPDNFNSNIIFISNLKRFSSLTDNQKEQLTTNNTIIATSNIGNVIENSLSINYHSLIDPKYTEIDNAGIMLLRLLKKMGIKEVSIVGYDGFKNNPHDNYYSDSMINTTNTEILNDRNSCISAQIKELQKTMHIHFLTPSLYIE